MTAPKPTAGRVTPLDELPPVAALIETYQELIERARTAGLTVILGTIAPLQPELAADASREGIRLALNDRIRTSGLEFVDSDAAIRSEMDPSHLDANYAVPDETHPSANGESDSR